MRVMQTGDSPQNRRVRTGLILCVLCTLCVLGAISPTDPSIYGFTTRSAAREHSVENRFLLLPSPEKARAAHAVLTAEPHVAGTPRDRVLSDWIRDRWREYGLEQVEIVEHQVLLPYATDVQLEMARTDAGGKTGSWH